MKVRLTLTLACLFVLGLSVVPVDEAASAPKHHVARKTGLKKTARTGGVPVSTQDVNGDGTPDVVVGSPPRPKPRKR